MAKKKKMKKTIKKSERPKKGNPPAKKAKMLKGALKVYKGLLLKEREKVGGDRRIDPAAEADRDPHRPFGPAALPRLLTARLRLPMR